MPSLILAAAWFTAPVRVERWAHRARSPLAIGVSAAWWVRRAIVGDGRSLLGWSVGYWLGDLVSRYDELIRLAHERRLPLRLARLSRL